MANFKRKISMLVVIFACLLILSSPLWASDEVSLNDTLESSPTNIPIEIDDNNETGSFAKLNEMIEANDTIELDRDYAYDAGSDLDYKNGIVIQKRVVIDGKGFSLDSTNQAKLFDIRAKGDLTLKNIILLNDNPVTASGIKNAGNLTFDNVTFTTQKQVAGGTFNAAIVNEGEFTVKNSNFKDSFINSTGSIFYVYGLLIKNSGDLSIENTNFTNNGIFARASTVQIQGGLIYNSRNLSLNKVAMNNSYIRVNATISGFFGFILGISNSSNISVNNSHFENSLVANDAKTNNAMTNVLRITNGDAMILNSRFINNTGSLNGGAIGNYAERDMLVENCMFDSNSVTIQGGAIFAQSNITSNNNTFRNNFAGRNGGAIYIYGFYDTGNPDLGNFISTNDLFEYNWVESSPDAYGEASILSWGGAICSKAGNMTIINDTFYRNKALMGDGGAIANYLSSGLQVSHCVFKENEATRWDVWTHASGLGGAILIPQTEMVDYDNYATFNIEYSIFDNNKGVAGTALYSVPYQNVPCDFISNNNYWGSNNPFFKELIGKYQLSDVVFPDNYVIMDIEGDEMPYIETSCEYKVTLNKVKSMSGEITPLNEVLPDWECNITADLGRLSNDTLVIKNGEATFAYDALKSGLETFTVNKKYYKRTIEVVKYGTDFNISAVGTIDGVIINISSSADVYGDISINNIYNASLDNGFVSLILPKLGSGVHELNIYYSGNDKYNPKSFNENITIEKIEIDAENISVPDKVDLANSNMISITLPKDATGKVLFDIDGNNYYANVDNGVASIDVSSLSAGVKQGRWKYLGDENYGEIAGNFSIEVKVKEKITDNRDIVMFYTDGSVYKVRLWGSDGKVVQGGNVVFTINGKSTTVKTDNNGYASLKLTQTPNKYLITAQYNNIKVQNTVLIKKVLTAKNLSKKKAKKIKYTAKVKGRVPFKGKKVTFKIKGKKYTAKTNKKGIATVYLKNLKVGKYKITITYAGTKITKTIKIKK